MSAAARYGSVALALAVGSGCKEDPASASGDAGSAAASGASREPDSELAPSDGEDITANAIHLIPEQAEVLVGVDFTAALRRPEWAALLRSERVPSELRGVTDACGLPLSTWRFVVAGLDANGSDSVVVASAAGLGTRVVLQCVLQRAELPLQISADGTRLDHGSTRGAGAILDDDTIAIATRGWVALLAARIDGEGTSVEDGALAQPLARTDRTRAIWFAAGASMGGAKRRTAELELDIHDAAGWIDVATGLDFDLTLGVDDAAAARLALERRWKSTVSMLSLFGVPQSAIGAVRFSDDDGVVRMSAHLHERDAATIVPALADRLRG